MHAQQFLSLSDSWSATIYLLVQYIHSIELESSIGIRRMSFNEFIFNDFSLIITQFIYLRIKFSIKNGFQLCRKNKNLKNPIVLFCYLHLLEVKKKYLRIIIRVNDNYRIEAAPGDKINWVAKYKWLRMCRATLNMFYF